MGDFDRVRDVGPFLDVNGDGSLPLGKSGAEGLRTHLEDGEAGGAGLRAPVADFGETAHLLQQLHHFYTGSHSCNVASVLADHVPVGLGGR
jgi:hypothetical protein